MPGSRPSLPLLVAIAVLLLTAGGALLEGRNYVVVRDAALGRLRQEAETQAQAQAVRFRAADTALRAVVAEAEARLASGQESQANLARHLSALAEALPGVVGLGVTDRQGRLLVGRARDGTSRTPARPLEIRVDDRDYFRWFAVGPGADGRGAVPFLGQPARSRLDGSWFLAMSRPLRAADGTFAGVALAAFGLAGEGGDGSLARLPDQAIAAIVGRQGIVIEARLPDVPGAQAVGRALEVLVPDYPLAPLRRAAGQRGTPVVAALDAGIAAVAPVPGSPLQVVLVQPWEAVLGGWWRQMVSDLGLLVVALLGLLTLAVPLVRALRDRDRLFDLSPDPICVCDRDGHFLRFNSAWPRVLGLAAADLVGRTHVDLVHPEERDAVHRAQAILCSGEALADQPLRYRTADGGDRWLAWSGVAEGDRLFILARDMTHRREAEQALRDSEQRFRDVSEAASEFIWEIDRGGRLTYASRRIRGVLGVTPDEVRGLPLLDLLIEEGREQLAAILRRGAPFVVEVPARRGTGEAWLRLSGQPVRGQEPERDEAEGAFAYRGAAQDVTEGRQARQALQDSEARYRGIVNTIVDAIVTIDERGTIRSVNPAAERLFGYAAREMIAKNVCMLMPEPHRSQHDGYLRAYIQGAGARAIGTGREVAARRKDGALFPMELGLSEVFLNGQRFFIGACRDLSERKRVERLKDEFIATVSHELRTPLTSIRGSLGLLGGGAVGALPEAAKSLVGVALDNCDRLTRLVDDILDIERIDNGLLPFDAEPLDLRAVVERAVADLAPALTEAEVEVVVAVGPVGDAPLVLRGDRERLLQLVSNLLANAIAYAPAGGVVRVGLDREGEEAVLRVADDGPGIPEDFRDRVFQRFSQADGSTTRSRGGSGLGLAIVRAIARRHGGRVGFVTSTEPPTGTTFIVRLPLEVPAGASEAGEDAGDGP